MLTNYTQQLKENWKTIYNLLRNERPYLWLHNLYEITRRFDLKNSKNIITIHYKINHKVRDTLIMKEYQIITIRSNIATKTKLWKLWINHLNYLEQVLVYRKLKRC